MLKLCTTLCYFLNHEQCFYLTYLLILLCPSPLMPNKTAQSAEVASTIYMNVYVL